MSIDVTEKLHREPPRVDPARDVAGGGPDHLSVLVGLAAVVLRGRKWSRYSIPACTRP
jgi:hypothetical protein